MPKIKLTKEEADKLMKTEGETRGVVLKTLEDYILSKKGLGGIKKVEEKLKELGYPFEFKKVFSFSWQSAAFSNLVVLSMLEVFDWDDSRAFDIGYNALINSRIAKLMLEKIDTMEDSNNRTPKIWKTYSTVGEMKFVEYNEKKRHSTLRLKGYKKYHPVSYEYFRGFLTRVAEIITKSKKVKVDQTKSLFNGDSYDDFEFTW